LRKLYKKLVIGLLKNISTAQKGSCFFVRAKTEEKISIKQNSKFMIRHTVAFKLKSIKDSTEEFNFFYAAKKLANIPGVENFECLKQTSKKNNFDYGLSMEFENNELYEKYSNHPDHINFIQQYWLKEVEDFLEIDYEPINQ
jgi:hypothetical protein